MLNKIKDVISPTEEVRLEQLKLENGTLLEAEKFAEGNEVFILTEDQKVALPVGEYQMESGETLVIKEEGIIADLGSYDDKMEDEEEEKEGMNEEKYPTREEFEELKKMVMEMRNVPEEAKEEDKEELSADIPEEVQQELSEPAVEPIKHSPEVKSTKKQVLYGQNRPMTTMDRVLNMINKNN